MSGKCVTLYEYGKPVFHGNVSGTVTEPVVNPLSDDTVTKPVVEHVEDSGIVTKRVVEPNHAKVAVPYVKDSVTFRVVIRTRGYPNGKLESQEEKFFANLEDAKAYARDKDYETPVSTTRAFVQAIIGFDVFTLCESNGFKVG